MTVPYRTRKFLKRFAAVLAVAALIAAAVWLVWLLWLGRFVVYSRDQGAILDFDQSGQEPGVEATPPASEETVPIHYYDYEQTSPTDPVSGLEPLLGYYIDAAALTANPDAVARQLEALPEGTPVLVDVKTIRGEFYYSSGITSARPENWDAGKMDSLLAQMREQGLYMIARFPALRDYQHGLGHVEDGIATAEGYLWMDSQGCYWLRPDSQGTLTYLTQILGELRSLGFREAVLADFCYPETAEAVLPAAGDEALSAAAKTLVTACATESFAVSFQGRDGSLLVPEGRSRLYLENVNAADVAAVAAQTGITDPAKLVFFTPTRDTRFEAYSVLRPLSEENLDQ